MAGLPSKQPSWGVADSDYSWQDGLMSPSAKKEKLNIAVVCTPHSGHMIPVMHISTELAQRGHKVRLYTTDYAKEEFEKKVQKTGAEFIGVDMKGKTQEELTNTAKDQGRIWFLLLEELMVPPLKKELMARRPDVVVTDFATLAGAVVAEELDLPLVINLPGPLSLMRAMCGMPDTSTAVNFLGLHISRQRLGTMALGRWLGVKKMYQWGEKMRMHIAKGALVLVQTIWGLDTTIPVIPSVVVTGPVLPAPGDLRERLAADHKELFKFLRESDGVVYVTTGSLAKLHEWQVKVLYNGLKKAKHRVVWSLKEELQQFLPNGKDDPDFFISKWTPQAELLQDPAVKVVITHCGWGGTLETLTAGKAIVAIPFFGDQPENARLMCAYGCAELIGRIPTGNEGSQNPYQEGWITEKSVESAVSKVMSSSSYTAAARKLMKASRASGGVESAAQHIEWAARFGTSHLKPANFQCATGSSPYNGVMAGLLAITGLAVAIAVRVKKSQ